MKLSKSQAELLSAMRNGTRVLWMDGLHSYYFRTDTMRHCTATARALRKAGAIEVKGDHYRHSLVIKAP